MYGYRQFGIEDQGWVAWFIIAAVFKKKITLYGNGKQIRDLLFIDDLIECGVTMHDPQVRPNTIDGIQKHYKGKLCAAVDLDEQMLPFCSPQDIHRQIREIVEKIASPDGGLVIYAIPSQDVPLENIDAIFTGWEKYCFFI